MLEKELSEKLLSDIEWERTTKLKGWAKVRAFMDRVAKESQEKPAQKPITVEKKTQ